MSLSPPTSPRRSGGRANAGRGSARMSSCAFACRISIAGVLALALFAATIAVCPTIPAAAQSAALTKEQTSAVAAYDKALRDFKAVLAQRRAQIDAKQSLSNLPGQAIYLARLNVMSTYKDLTDVLPSRIGRPNKFNVPPAYFDADIEPLIEEYAALFRGMQAPPKGAQASATPFEDVADLGRAIGRAKGLDAADRRSRRAHQPRRLLRRDQRQPEHRQRPLQHLQGQPADGTSGRPQGPHGSGRRSSRRSRKSIRRLPRATTRRRRASARATSATIIGPRCATA